MEDLKEPFIQPMVSVLEGKTNSKRVISLRERRKQ